MGPSQKSTTFLKKASASPTRMTTKGVLSDAPSKELPGDAHTKDGIGTATTETAPPQSIPDVPSRDIGISKENADRANPLKGEEAGVVATKFHRDKASRPSDSTAVRGVDAAQQKGPLANRTKQPLPPAARGIPSRPPFAKGAPPSSSTFLPQTKSSLTDKQSMGNPAKGANAAVFNKKSANFGAFATKKGMKSSLTEGKPRPEKQTEDAFLPGLNRPSTKSSNEIVRNESSPSGKAPFELPFQGPTPAEVPDNSSPSARQQDKKAPIDRPQSSEYSV